MERPSRSLDPIFSPRSVAVVGASRRRESIGFALVHNLVLSEFQGAIYPVNPQADVVHSLKCYPSIAAIPDPLDLAVIAVPRPGVLQAVEECLACNVRGLVVITAGFSEVGPEGAKLEHEMLDAATRTGVRIVGPNCLGIIAAEKRLNVSFAYETPPVGGISLLSQSGAVCTGMISYAFEEHIGYRHFVSMGDKCDVQDHEVIDYFADDAGTNCIALYVEALKQPRAFYEAARRASLKKPFVAIKVGRTAAGAKAASSHTGSIAGADAAYEAAFRQSGVQRARTLPGFIDASRALSSQPLPRGKRICVLTNAGGPGVITADALYDMGLELVKLRPETIEKMNPHCPSSWAHGNPADIIGDAGPDRYRECLRIVNQADEVDGIVLLMTQQSMTQPMKIAEAIVDIIPELKKPITASFIGQGGEDAENFLEERGVPEFEFPERAAEAMAALCTRAEIVRRQQEEV